MKKLIFLSGVLGLFVVVAKFGFSFGLDDVTGNTPNVSGSQYVLTFKNMDSVSYPFECKCLTGTKIKTTLAAGETKTCVGERCSYYIDLKPSGKTSVYSGNISSLSRKTVTFIIKDGSVTKN